MHLQFTGVDLVFLNGRIVVLFYLVTKLNIAAAEKLKRGSHDLSDVVFLLAFER